MRDLFAHRPTGEDLADITRPRTLRKGRLHKRPEEQKESEAIKSRFRPGSSWKSLLMEDERRERANATDGKRPQKGDGDGEEHEEDAEKRRKGKEEEGTSKKVGLTEIPLKKRSRALERAPDRRATGRKGPKKGVGSRRGIK